MASFRAKYRDGMDMKKVRINFAPHAYMFEGSQPGDTRQVHIHTALYTQWNTSDTTNGNASLADLIDPNLHGIEECAETDSGRMAVNPVDFLSDRTLQEVHLHPVQDSQHMAVSPNNCAFLLNLTLPIVNFSIMMGHNTEQGAFKLTFMNVTFLNEETLADCAVLSALNSEMLLQTITGDEANEDLEMAYLKQLKRAIETSVLPKLSDTQFMSALFDDGEVLTLFHRKIWLSLGCPRIDDIGGKIHRELSLDSRLTHFKRTLLSSILLDNIFKAH